MNAEIEKQYTNRARVANWEEIVGRWQAGSAAFMSSAEGRAGQVNVPYGPSAREVYDVFTCPGSDKLMIFIHGGYWRSFEKEAHRFIAPAWLKAGYSVAFIEYELCPKVSMTGLTMQIEAALNHLAEHMKESRWLLTGHSAGGHLAAMMWRSQARLSQAVVTRLQAAMSLSGVHDLKPMLDFSANVDLRLTEQEALLLSPYLYQPKSSRQFLAAVGGDESDGFKYQTKVLSQAWALHEPDLEVPGRNHFDVLLDLADAKSDLFQRTHSLL